MTLREGLQTFSFSVQLQRPYLLSCQAGTPHCSHTKENPAQDAQPTRRWISLWFQQLYLVTLKEAVRTH
jgi:hypothetical protein